MHAPEALAAPHRPPAVEAGRRAGCPWQTPMIRPCSTPRRGPRSWLRGALRKLTWYSTQPWWRGVHPAPWLALRIFLHPTCPSSLLAAALNPPMKPLGIGFRPTGAQRHQCWCSVRARQGATAGESGQAQCAASPWPGGWPYIRPSSSRFGAVSPARSAGTPLHLPVPSAASPP